MCRVKMTFKDFIILVKLAVGFVMVFVVEV